MIIYIKWMYISQSYTETHLLPSKSHVSKIYLKSNSASSLCLHLIDPSDFLALTAASTSLSYYDCLFSLLILISCFLDSNILPSVQHGPTSSFNSCPDFNCPVQAWSMVLLWNLAIEYTPTPNFPSASRLPLPNSSDCNFQSHGLHIWLCNYRKY